MLEVIFQLSSALDAGITDLTNFSGVKFVPFPSVKLIIKVCDEFCMDEVEKGVANIAVILN